MRFIDSAKIKISAGHGGPGCVSFRREKFAPVGGPDGGDGGRGGDVFFTSTTGLGTLQDFRFKRIYKAENGHHGSGTNKAGRDGEDIEIKIPVGTVIKQAETEEVLFDFTEPNQRWLAVKGGRGGKGNAHFVSSTFQAPKMAQPGEPGQDLELTLELKLLADVGLIGYPNAGKSTLISRMSAAQPKIADYPFTTLVPNLGVVFVEEFQHYVVADIPGLIEGASEGAGLGHRFLKHIERTQILVHLLDGAHLLEFTTRPDDEPGANAKHGADELARLYKNIRKELHAYNPELTSKQEFVVINKADLFYGQDGFLDEVIKHFQKKIKSQAPVQMLSSATGEGVRDLSLTLWRALKGEL